MEITRINNKNNLKINIYKTDQFKTIFFALFSKDELVKSNTSKDRLLEQLLKNANNKYKSIKSFSKYKKDLYDIKSNVSVNYIGKARVFEFSATGLNSKFIDNDIDMTKELFNTINMMLLNPFVKLDSFNKQYFDETKETYFSKLKSFFEDKRFLAKSESNKLYKDFPFLGIDEYGDLQSIKNIDEKEIYKYYKDLFSGEFELYVLGDVDVEKIKKLSLEFLNFNNMTKDIVIKLDYEQ